MTVLTHKFGLELDLASAETRHPDHKNGIAAKIRRKVGVIFAEFSQQHPDIVVVEYDPSITTPNDICKSAKHLNGDFKRKIFL